MTFNGNVGPHKQMTERSIENNHRARTSRFIELPTEIYSLRESFPSALKFLLLECQRCAQWVPIEVTSSVPDVLPCTLRPEDHTNIFSTTWSHVPSIHLSSSSVLDAHAAISMDECNSSTSSNRETGRSTEMSEEHHAWHSPRLRAREQEAPASSTEDAVHGSQVANVPPPKREPLYIPNPACFVCSGLLCEKGDRLLDLRLDWLKSLYTSCMRGEGQPTNHHDSVNMEDEEVRSNLKARVTSKLSDELDIRRSRRLANQRKQFSGTDALTEDHLTSTSPFSSSSGDWIQKLSKKVLEDDTVLSSCFCWVVCDLCGKVRRTAQPFPGGAPFVCALSVAGSCNTSEAEGLMRYNQAYTTRTVHRISLNALVPPVPLVLPSQSNSETTEPPKVHMRADALLKAYQNEPVLHQLSVYAGMTESSSTSHCGVCCDPKKLFPSLKLLTSTVRKRSIANTVKKVVLNPEEIRKKREEAIRAMFTEDETLKGNEQVVTPTPPVKLKEEEETVCPKKGFSVKEETDEGELQVARGRKGRDKGQTGHNKITHNISPGVQVVDSTAGDGKDSVPQALSPSSLPERRKTRAEHQLKLEGTDDGTPTCTAFASIRQSSRRVQTIAAAMPTELEETEYKPVTVEVPPPLLPQREHPQAVDAVEQSKASSSVAAAPAKRSRGRPPKSASTVAAPPPTKKRRTSEIAVVHWIQCDICDKWRIVPEPIKPETWWCAMRPGTTCEDPEDVE